MDLDFVRNVVVIFNTLGLAVIGFLFWLRKPGEDAGAAVHGLRAELHTFNGAMQLRLARVEERIEHMPDSKEFATLEGSLKTIASQQHGQNENLVAMRAQLVRIESWMMNNK